MESVWLLKLRENVLGPLKKITGMAGGAQKKFTDMATASSRFAKQHTTAVNHAAGSLNGLTQHLRRLKELQADAWNPKHIKNYEKAIRATQRSIDQWNANKVLPGDRPGFFKRHKQNLADAANEIPMLSAGMRMAGNPLVLAGAAAGVALKQGFDASKAAMEFEYGMAKINATAQLPQKQLERLRTRLEEIGGHSGGNFDRITDAYEKILSTTGKVNLSLDITETAVKGAKAGFADIDLVAGALAQTLATVGSKNATANEVLDTLLKAKAVGAGEFADFAQYLPGLIASAKNLGMAYKDTAGLFSYMTFTGQSAERSAMLIQNMITSLQKKEIIVGLQKKGIDPFNIDGSRKNITKLFLELEKKLHGMTDKQRTKFLIDIGLNDAQAREAWSVLTSDAMEFKRVMGEVNDEVGETNRQLMATGNRKTNWREIGDQWKQIKSDFGELLLPLADKLMDRLQEIVGTLKESDSEYRKKMFDKGDASQRAHQIVMAEYEKRFVDPHKKGQLIPGTNQQFQSDFAGRPRQKVYPELVEGLPGAPMHPHLKWFKKWEAEAMKRMGFGDPNAIDPDEKKDEGQGPMATLGGIDNTSFEDGKKKGEHEGNRGLKTLIMNVDITNNNHHKEDLDGAARKMTDDLVDAARDAMVTIGID